MHTALASGSGRYPSAALARDGFVVQPQFLDADAAGRLREALSYLAERTVKSVPAAGVAVRDRADRQDRDLNVRQVLNVDRLDPGVSALIPSERIDAAMRAFTGRDVRLGSMTLQVDWPDTETKRGLHVDSHWPVTFKAFLYLTDVTEPANGPFAAVPGSHRHRLRKLAAIVHNAARRKKLTDLDGAYRLDEARCLTGAAGTAIFADQRLAHAGWPGHTTGTRLMLVGYFYDATVEVPAFLR